MSWTITQENLLKREWAIQLAPLGMTQAHMGSLLEVDRTTISRWLKGVNSVHKAPCMVHINGHLVHHSGTPVHSFSGGHPPHPKPQLFCGSATDMHFLDDGSVDLIITSPPYNLGNNSWDMGGNGRTAREEGIGYSDKLPEAEYQANQVTALQEMFRVTCPGGSLFYNHKVRQHGNTLIHPMAWLNAPGNPWTLRQEIIWDRISTHNHEPSLFWQTDERIYWLTKGKPSLNGPIKTPTVWREHGPTPNTWHPAPFTPALPRFVLDAVGMPGITVLDPFGGGMTTCLVAHLMGYKSIGVDINPEYLDRVRATHGW